MNGHDTQRAILYHYGELNPQESTDFEQHLAQCRNCQAELAALRALGEAHLHAQPPQRSLDAIRKAVCTPRHALAERIYLWLRPAVALAVIAVAAFAAHKYPEPEKPAAPAAVAMKWDDGFETKLASVTDETRGESLVVRQGVHIENFDYRASKVEDEKTKTAYYTGRL